MSVLSQFTNNLVRKQQIFTTSGTFVPSATLLARGGWVEVTCVGGGGGGFNGSSSGGGGGGAVVKKIVQVTGNVTVTIGAGGIAGAPGTPGGTTSFGSLVSAAGGDRGWSTGGQSGNGFISKSLHGAGAGGHASDNGPGPGINGYGVGGLGVDNDSPAPSNTGCGGNRYQNGASGICIVEWFE